MAKIAQIHKKGTRDGKSTYRELGRFGAVPHTVYDHKNYKQLTAHGRMLLIDVVMQLTGNNNGDLCIAWSVMSKHGWRSNQTLQAAKAELLHYGFIVCTRHGGLGFPSLFAVTWLQIHECGGKLHTRATTKPPGTWRQETNLWTHQAWVKSRKRHACKK